MAKSDRYVCRSNSGLLVQATNRSCNRRNAKRMRSHAVCWQSLCFLFHTDTTSVSRVKLTLLAKTARLLFLMAGHTRRLRLVSRLYDRGREILPATRSKTRNSQMFFYTGISICNSDRCIIINFIRFLRTDIDILKIFETSRSRHVK